MSWTWSDQPIGTVRVCYWYEKCVACGARYHPKYIKTGPNISDIVCCSDHVCDPKRLKKREEELRHEWDDPEIYCECDELDCKFEYLDILMNEME